MKITADARRHHSGKTHTLYEGKCSALHHNGGFVLYGYTNDIRTSLNGMFTIQITLSLEELDAIRATEIAALRSAIARLEKKVEAS